MKKVLPLDMDYWKNPIFRILLMLTATFLSCSVMAIEKAYLIGPGDILNLKVYAGGEKQRDVDLIVTDQGMVNVPFIGLFKAGGLTFNQLEERITVPLANDYFVHPQVHVTIKEYHSLRYFIAGSVKKPGLYETRNALSLMEIIAKSGGVLTDRGNIAYILRKSVEKMERGGNISSLLSQNRQIKVDLIKLLDQGDLRGNVVLEPGDVVYIPPKQKLNVSESKIYVGGEVVRPGFYDYQPGLTALKVCIMAGGFDKFAAPNRARIIRSQDGREVVEKINLDKVKKGELSDVELKPGDRIFIPETWL